MESYLEKRVAEQTWGTNDSFNSVCAALIFYQNLQFFT